MEPYIYLALFLLVAVGSLVFRWFKAQVEKAPTDHLEPGPWMPPHRPAKVTSAKPPAAAGDLPLTGPPRRAPSAGPSPLRGQPPARLAAGGSVPDLRRGMVWMTILGPCRGLEPPGRIAAGGTTGDKASRS